MPTKKRIYVNKNKNKETIYITLDSKVSKETVVNDDDRFHITKVESEVKKSGKMYVTVEMERRDKLIESSLDWINKITRKKIQSTQKQIIHPAVYAMNVNDFSKELSESGALSKYIVNNKLLKTDDKNTILYCVGDGSIGLTGYIMSIATSWKIISFDPLANDTIVNENFSICKKYDYDVDLINVFDNKTKIVVMALHSHGNIQMFYERLKNFYAGLTYVIMSVPCCGGFKSKLKFEETQAYVDYSSLSEKNKYYVYEGSF
ncbi:hypothetical protein Catovirus_1_223 [Catovirus CTV1]|uniref:Uncharacterized protein n=1 Tax=Catovirus CTV1 TaxID=1977631 RepID=A0A1V0S8Y9_9VIRU|nr:hypothetical protein Catovirus_1_223 [Catovirus CTV1]